MFKIILCAPNKSIHRSFWYAYAKRHLDCVSYYHKTISEGHLTHFTSMLDYDTETLSFSNLVGKSWSIDFGLTVISQKGEGGANLVILQTRALVLAELYSPRSTSAQDTSPQKQPNNVISVAW